MSRSTKSRYFNNFQQSIFFRIFSLISTIKIIRIRIKPNCQKGVWFPSWVPNSCFRKVLILTGPWCHRTGLENGVPSPRVFRYLGTGPSHRFPARANGSLFFALQAILNTLEILVKRLRLPGSALALTTGKIFYIFISFLPTWWSILAKECMGPLECKSGQ